jgi:zinc protease
MTRDDLVGHYRQYYVPDNATLVVVGDVDSDEVMERVRYHFGAFEPGAPMTRLRTREPEQTGERRLVIRKAGTAAYLKMGYHAPAVSDPLFVPALVLDAVLSGAKGVNLWSSFNVAPPQRSARLYKAVVERGLASAIQAALLPTADPFLYTISATATDGIPLDAVEQSVLDVLEGVARDGITESELARGKAQLHARMVFDQDSVTNLAHQLGYFETIAAVSTFTGLPARIVATTVDEVNTAASTIFRASNRTVGWFDPLPPGERALDISAKVPA